jgi:oxygen-dependent protoporphyrinogen oxidase
LETKRYHIIGSGFSALTLAYYLKKENSQIQIHIHEKDAYCGGLLQSHLKEGEVVEEAANALLDSEEIQNLAKEVGVELLEANAKIKRAAFYRKRLLRSLYSWPLTLMESLVFSFKILVLMKKKLQDQLPLPLENQSLDKWAELHLGVAARAYLVDPAMAGIYAAPLENLSASLILKRFFTKKNSPKKSKKILSVAPRQGMHQLCLGLKSFLESQGVVFHFNSLVDESKAQEILQESPSNHLVFCGSLVQAQEFLGAQESVKQKFPDFFALKMLPIVSSTLLFKDREKKVPYSFGLLFPRVQKRPFLGVLFNAQIFPQRSKIHSETWIRSLALEDETSFKKELLQERKYLFKSPQQPLAFYVKAWPRGLPLYNLALESFLDQKWPSMEEELLKSRIYIHGNYLGQLGLSQLLLRSKSMVRRMQLIND